MGGSRRDKTAEHDLEGNGKERRCACSSPPYSSPQSPRDRTPFLILHSLVYFMLLISLVILFQILAAPFAAGALFLQPPWAFISLIPSNIIGEMWVGVTLTMVVELVPNTIRSPAIAGYLFIISIIGGNVPLLVPPLKNVTSLRTALYILFPGLYLVSSVFFLLTLFSLKRDLRRAQEEEEVIKPLLPETPTTEYGGKSI